MNHKDIDQLYLVDRYLMGKMPSEESAAFEEHFIDCPQCIDRLQTTKTFLRDMQLIAARQTVLLNYDQPKTSFRHYLGLIHHKPLALAFACLLLGVIVGTIFVANHMRLLRGEINQAKSLSEQWERRYEAERQSAIAADRSRQEAESQQTERLRALEAELEDEKAQRSNLTAELSRRAQTAGDLPISILYSVRSGGTNSAESIYRIDLPRDSTLFALSIHLEDEQQFDSYRIKIFNDRGRRVWHSGRLTPDSYNSLSRWFKSDFFPPGHYSLIVEGVKKQGERTIVGKYPFLITRPQ